MILASHDTMTYRKPKQWWLRPIAFTARCQSVDYKMQYAHGARYFDIRLCFDKKGHIEFGHGLFRYDATDIYDVVEFLATFSYGARIVLEKGTSKADIERFSWWCRYFEAQGVAIYGGEARALGWKEVYHCKRPTPQNQTGQYSSVCGHGLLSWFPELWARLFNKEVYKEWKDRDIIVFTDFLKQWT